MHRAMLRKEERIAIREAIKNHRHQPVIIDNNDRNNSYSTSFHRGDGSNHQQEHHPRDYVVHPSSGSRPDDVTTLRFPPIFRDDGPSSTSNKFWFEKANGALIGDGSNGPTTKVEESSSSSSSKRVCQSSGDGAGPSGVQLSRRSSNDDGNKAMEVGGMNRHLQARIASSVGSAVVSINNADQVRETIKQMEREEHHRRVQMVADLQKLCKAIPLTVKMVIPLINFNGLP